MGPLYSITQLHNLLKRYHLAPLKQLGQNFLIDENIIDKIAFTCCDPGDFVLEIGPGVGGLTQALSKRAKKVVAVEIDHGMVEILKETLLGYTNTTVIHQDILKTDLKKLVEEEFDFKPFVVVGNLPYYITSKCMMHVLESPILPIRFTAMVQKEVAERYAAKPKQSNYGAITASLAYFGEVKRLFDVSGTCFYPRPDVDSSVIQLKPWQAFDVDRKKYAKVIKSAFQMRRKTMLNNLKAGFGLSAKEVEEVLRLSGIDPKSRAEELPPQTFALLAKNMWSQR